jgi:predicted RNase H-like HicB family nuclease
MDKAVFVVLESQDGESFVATSPLLPELVTGGESFLQTVDNLRGALGAVLELYEIEGKPFPEAGHLGELAAKWTEAFGPASGERQELVCVESRPGEVVATSRLLPELVTGGESFQETVNNLRGALGTVLALYRADSCVP